MANDVSFKDLAGAVYLLISKLHLKGPGDSVKARVRLDKAEAEKSRMEDIAVMPCQQYKGLGGVASTTTAEARQGEKIQRRRFERTAAGAGALM